MKRVKNIFFIFIFTFAMIALASCTIIDDTHIHRFEDGVCDCGDLETNYPEVKKYEVALVDGSNVIAKFEIMEGTLVPEVKAPVKLGQVFLGWFNGEVKWDFNKMPVASELVLEARYVDNAKYDIVYQLNGGEFAGEVETSYVSGIGLDKLPEPVRSNYIFLGWYVNGEKVESISSTQIGTLTLVAKWESVNYDITYELNGGSFYDGAKIPDNYAEGEGLAELPVARRDSYIFDGWMLNGELIDAIDPAHVGDVTLSAKWTPVVYTISYQLNGGELLEEVTEKYTVEDLVNLPKIQKVGYTFNGWLLNGNKVENIKVGTSGNLVLVADWKVNQYTLTINVDGVKQEIEYDYNEAVEAVAAPTKVGYTFTGWDKEVPANMPAEDVEIKATWKVNQYTLTINVDGVKQEIEYDYNEAVEAVAAPSKVGYTFTGWDKEVPANMPAEDVEIKATWKVNQYTLTINVDGVKQEIEYDYNEAVEAVAAPTKLGYAFVGWDKEVPANMPAEDVEITATWNLVKYSINLDADGGILPTQYKSVDEAIADFLADYNAARGKSHTVDTFKELGSWGEISDASMFLYNATYRAKWAWLVDYIASVAGSANKAAYQNFNKYNSQAELNAANSNYIYSIAYELRGWVGQIKYTKNGNFVTADYSDPTVSGKVWNYVQLPEYTVESEAVALIPATREGYVFLGWYDGDAKVSSIAPNTACDVELKAKWELAPYVITYDGNGADVPAHYQSIEAAIADFLADYNTARGKSHTVDTFKELGSWGEISDASLFLYNATYRAKWAWLVDYIATVAGSANKAAYQNFNNYNSQAELNAANGNYIYEIAYELRGWVGQIKYTKNSGFVTADYSDPTVSEKVWNHVIQNVYTVETESIPLPELTRSGFEFLGWYLNDEKVEAPTKGLSGDITLVAKWEAKSIASITYVSDGGTWAKVPYSTHKQVVDEFLKDFSAYSGTTITNPAEYWASSAKTNFWKDANMNAKWRWMFEFFISLDSSHQYFPGILANPASVSGYATQNVALFLLGINATTWANDYAADYTGLSSKWTCLDFTSTQFADYAAFLPEEFSSVVEGPTEYSVGSSQEIILPEYSKNGAEFLGWYDQLGNKVEMINSETTGDLVLTAKWNNVMIGETGYATLADAIAAAQAGDVLVLAEGEYNFPSVLSKSITLKGVDKQKTILNVLGNSSNPKNLDASDITFDTLTIKGLYTSGNVSLENTGNTKNITVKNCIVTDFKTFMKIDQAASGIVILYENTTFERISQFILWTTASMNKVVIKGCTVNATTCGATTNGAAALFRVRSGSLEAYNNTFNGDSKNTPGYFECIDGASVVMYNTFVNVTKYNYTTANNKLTYNNNLYLDAEGNVLNSVPSGVSGTGVTPDTNIYASEADRAAGYATFIG